jgi:hypothetical protein
MFQHVATGKSVSFAQEHSRRDLIPRNCATMTRVRLRRASLLDRDQGLREILFEPPLSNRWSMQFPPRSENQSYISQLALWDYDRGGNNLL